MPEYFSPKHKIRVELSDELIKDMKAAQCIDIPAMIYEWLEAVDDNFDAEQQKEEKS